MNATVFGKPYWEFLHGVAAHLVMHASKDDLCAAWSTLIGGMSRTTPCSACQRSIGGFVDEVTAATGKTPLEHARSGTAPMWTSLVHEKVEFKLARQRWERDACPKLVQVFSKTEVGAAASVAADAAAAANTRDDSSDTDTNTDTDTKTKPQTKTSAATSQKVTGVRFGSSALEDAVLLAGTESKVAELMTKLPTTKVQNLRRDLEEWQRDGRPFAVDSMWTIVLIMSFFHEFVSAEDKQPVPAELAPTFESFAVLTRPWYPEDAEQLLALSHFVHRHRRAQLAQLAASASQQKQKQQQQHGEELRGGAHETKQKVAGNPKPSLQYKHLSPDIMAGTLTDRVRAQHRGADRHAAHVRGGFSESMTERARARSRDILETDFCETRLLQAPSRPTVEDLTRAANTLSLFDAAVLCRFGMSAATVGGAVVGDVSVEHRKRIADARKVFGALQATTCNPVTCA